MSLEAIRDLRRAGQKPTGVVQVLIGRWPKWLEDDMHLVVIRPKDDPRFMDWRPLVGLSVAVFSAETKPARTLAVLEAIEAAGAKFFGAADPNGVYPMTVGAGQAHEAVLHASWRALCR